jgi:ATP-dependent protease ClpP protease subunit
VDLSRYVLARPSARRAGKPAESWFRMALNEARPSSADIWIYAEIGYWGVTAADFVRDLVALNVTDLTVHVNSPGGDAFDGIAIYNSLVNHPATVTMRVEGLAASAASFITQAGDTIVMERNAQMMIHDASGMAMGPADVMRETADLLDKLSDNIADIYAQRAGGDVASWRAVMLAETWYSSAEAHAAGLVDEVAGTEDEPASDDAMDKLKAAWTGSTSALRGHYEAGTIQPIVEPVSRETHPLALDLSAISNALKGALL